MLSSRIETIPLNFFSIPEHYRLIPYQVPIPQLDRIKRFFSHSHLSLDQSPSQPTPTTSNLTDTRIPSPEQSIEIIDPKLQYIQSHTNLTSQDILQSIPRKPTHLSQEHIQPRYEQLHQYLQTRETLPNRVDSSTDSLITQALVLFPTQENSPNTKLDASSRRATKLIFQSLKNHSNIPELISQAQELSQQHHITHIPWNLIQKSLLGQESYQRKITQLKQANIPVEGLSAIQVNQKIKNLDTNPPSRPHVNTQPTEPIPPLKRVTQYFHHHHPALSRIAIAGALAFTLNSCTTRPNTSMETPINPNNHTQIIPSSTEYMNILAAQNNHFQVPTIIYKQTSITLTPESSVTPTQFSSIHPDTLRLSQIEKRIQSLETQVEQLSQTSATAPTSNIETHQSIPIIISIKPITRPNSPHLTISTPDITPPESKNIMQFPQFYTVQKGDCLSLIASHFYGQGNGHHYTLIANANNIANPNLIHPGQILTIPALN